MCSPPLMFWNHTRDEDGKRWPWLQTDNFSEKSASSYFACSDGKVSK